MHGADLVWKTEDGDEVINGNRELVQRGGLKELHKLSANRNPSFALVHGNLVLHFFLGGGLGLSVIVALGRLAGLVGD